MDQELAGTGGFDDLGTPLHRDLARNILALLREQGAARGTRLSRPALAQALGVSRTPVNGAVALLEKLGVVIFEGRSVRLLSLELAPAVLRSEDEETGLDRLLVEIARGRADGIVPDEVSERQLAAMFDASRGLVVQALTQLAEGGAVSRNRGHGWRFAREASNGEERAASYRFRLLVEPAGLVEPTFALPADFADRTRTTHLGFLERPWRDEDAIAFFRVNAAFHAGLAEASGNRFIAAAVTQQNRVRMLSNYTWRLGRERVEVSVREHLAILDTLLTGDQERASTLMRLHLLDALALRPGSRR